VSARPVRWSATNAVARITTKCNQACVFCCQSGRSWKGDPSEEEVRRDLEALRRRGVDTVVFMQGETLLRRDVAAILAHARACGYVHIGVATNGTLLADATFLQTLVNSGLGFVELSIHSHLDEGAARISGRAFTHARQQAALRNLRSVGSQLSVRYNTVVCRENAHHLVGLLHYLLDWSDRERFMMNLKFPFIEGRASRCPDALLRYADVDLYPLLGVVDQLDLDVRLENFPLCLVPGSEHRVLKTIDIIQRVEYFSQAEGEAGAYRAKGRYAEAYRHLEPCQACSLSAICPGPDNRYAERFSTHGLRPSTRSVEEVTRKVQERLGR
jgi:pyruvate-formate lyase-activating enzyme